MSLAAKTPSRDRLAYFRELRARLDPTGDPADAITHRYVDVPGSISFRLTAELALAPRSTHLVIGGGGLGKTTELLVAQLRVLQIGDIRALYIDVSQQHDIAQIAPGDLAVQVNKRLREGRCETEHRVALLDGLDRMTDLQAFERIVLHDVNALTSNGISVVLVGPLRVMTGPNRTLLGHFESFHYLPAIDTHHVESTRTFFADILRKRVPADAFSDSVIQALVLASGGVLRDLLALAQSACVEAYLHGADCVSLVEVTRVSEQFQAIKGRRDPCPSSLDATTQLIVSR